MKMRNFISQMVHKHNERRSRRKKRCRRWKSSGGKRRTPTFTPMSWSFSTSSNSTVSSAAPSISFGSLFSSLVIIELFDILATQVVARRVEMVPLNVCRGKKDKQFKGNEERNIYNTQKPREYAMYMLQGPNYGKHRTIEMMPVKIFFNPGRSLHNKLWGENKMILFLTIFSCN